MGSNFAECHPVGFRWAMKARERGCKLIHVDPRFTRTGAMCDMHVPIRAGTDIAFLGGLINYIITTERWFKEYVLHYTNASTIIADTFQDTEDLGGLFSGFEPRHRKYDISAWAYDGTESVQPELDQSADQPHSKEGQPGAFRLSVNDLVVKAAAVTLRRFPNVNAAWTEDAILQFHDVDISVAVALPDGLITPIVRKADQKGLAAISNEMKDLAARARAGRLKPEEFQGGGFCISNMGMYGVKDFAAIINPPQAGILAVSAGEQRPVVKDGALAIATVMTCTLSVDHRVIDGALAAEWLAAFRRTVEDPLSLML